MIVTSSYDVQIVGVNKAFQPTVKIYREALAFLVDVFNKEWTNLSAIGDKLLRFNAAEHLVHTTKDYIAKYDFDKKFHKFPSYLRRDAIQTALGYVSSYNSLYKNWVKSGKAGKEPKFQVDHYMLPVFYKDNMYRKTDDPNVVELKLYIKNDWIWYPVKLRATDIKYINKYWSGKKESAPVLEKRYKKYYLRFAFQEKVELSNTPIEEQKILAVDLGINNDATCSVIKPDGTILARKFIDFPGDKDHLEHTLNKIKKKQQQGHSVKNLWRYAKNCNEQHAIRVATAIVDYALWNNVDCIVFEHLDIKGKKKGSKKQKLAMWRKNGIQDIAAHKAHRNGIRISRICAYNTSKLAFDGSGIVKRDEKNYSQCTFTTGKKYNCDLNASYNIGARYFIRELLKPLPATERSQLEAKVPLISKRTQCGLSTLISLNAVLCNSAA